jgi:uroporphyrinogen-III synthase
MPTLLREAGAKVTEVVAYRTVAPKADEEKLERVKRAEVDAVVFASPSAYHNLAQQVGSKELARLSKRVQFAAIGATTAGAIREAGAQVATEAREASAACLAAAIAKYYERSSSGVAPSATAAQARRA